MFLVVCYDIADDRRRNRVRKTLRAFGDPVQESVFEAQVDRKQMDRLKRRIASTLEEGDYVRYYLLCASCAGRCEGTEGHPTLQDHSLHIF